MVARDLPERRNGWMSGLCVFNRRRAGGSAGLIVLTPVYQWKNHPLVLGWQKNGTRTFSDE